MLALIVFGLVLLAGCCGPIGDGGGGTAWILIMHIYRMGIVPGTMLRIVMQERFTGTRPGKFAGNHYKDI